MKARIFPGWLSGVVLAAGLVGVSVAREAFKPFPTTPAPQSRAGVSPAPAAVPNAGTPTVSDAPSPSPAVSGAATGNSLPSNTHVSPWLYEVERLTQAQVDESVILAYVANSAGTFNLTA